MNGVGALEMRCPNHMIPIQRPSSPSLSFPSRQRSIHGIGTSAELAVHQVGMPFPFLGSRPRLSRQLMNLNALTNNALLKGPSAISRGSNLSRHQPQLIITIASTIEELEVNIISRMMIGDHTSIRRPHSVPGLVRDAGSGTQG